MSVHPTIAAPGHRRRTWLLPAGLVAVVAAGALAAGLSFSFDHAAPAGPKVLYRPSAAAQRPTSLMQLTPGAVAAGALGGYALPVVPVSAHGPTLQGVLASMSPQTRRYTERIMSLTFAQLAAGAGGHP